MTVIANKNEVNAEKEGHKMNNSSKTNDLAVAVANTLAEYFYNYLAKETKRVPKRPLMDYLNNYFEACCIWSVTSIRVKRTIAFLWKDFTSIKTVYLD